MPNCHSSSIYNGKSTIPGYLADYTLKNMVFFLGGLFFLWYKKILSPDSVIFFLPGSPQGARAAENP
jgi:hypothetical protein